MTDTCQEKARVPFLPYGRQTITAEDITAVSATLTSDWLTQGPTINRFEEQLAQKVGADFAVACSSGTAALHLAMLALGIGKGDTVVTSPNTFLADANCGRFVGADVAFADIDAETGNMLPEALEAMLTTDLEKKIKVIVPVHFAGLPCDIARIREIAKAHGALVVEDACHAIGASYEFDQEQIKVGSGRHSDLTVFSFHPVKHVAMGEGGAISTNSDELAARLRLFRSHGMVKNEFDFPDMAVSSQGEPNPWYYEMQQLGYNYRLTDMQAALGLSQLSRLEASVAKRNRLANEYDCLIGEVFPRGTVKPLKRADHRLNAFHLYVVRIDFEGTGVTRAEVMNRLRDEGIGTQVHYIPVPLQPYYRKLTGATEGDFPGAEKYYALALSLPMYPALEKEDCRRVVKSLKGILG